MHRQHARSSLAFVVASLISACGGPTASAPDSSRVVLYRNGVGYFERDATIRGGELSIAVRNHELDDVLTTLAVVDRSESGGIVPVAALPAPGGEEEIHRLRFAVGEGATRVRVAWATQTPAWRVSYRLVLPSSESDDEAGHLSAWAVVDNTTAEDWRGVRLTLATAEPLSFAVDLRTPHYVDRPDVTGYVAPRIAAGPVFAENVRRGARTDRDADGILDEDDQCPEDGEQYNGIEDDDGCPDRGAVLIESNSLAILEAIYFESRSTEIRPRSEPILDAIVATLRGNPDITAEIQGHADAAEPHAYRLAAERAGVVREALIARGIDAGRLSLRGFGPTQPLDSRRTPEAQARNRRVSFSAERRDQAPSEPSGIVAREMSRTTRVNATSRTGIGGTRFVIERPVDVPAGRSALVAALSVDVTAEELHLFRPDPDVPDSAVHPFRAARLDNHTEVDLVPGPVALYGHGRLLGQGMIRGLRAGEDVIIPWALDDATRVHHEANQEIEPVELVRVAGARAVLRTRVTRRVVYRVRAGRHAPPRILIRHALSAPAELVSPPPGTERGEGFALVPLPISASQESVLILEERRHVEETVDLNRDLSIDLAPFLAGTTLSSEVRERFEEIRRDRRALRQSAAQTRSLHRRLAEHGVRTAELRAALESLPDGAGIAPIRRRLARQLLDATTDGEAISAQLAALTAAEVEARGGLRAVAAAFVWPSRDAGEGELAQALEVGGD